MIHLPMTRDPVALARFIATCDAMLHARKDGETFGLSIAEFSSQNKPVLTYASPPPGADAHLRELGTKVIRYSSETELIRELVTFDRDASAKKDWRAFKAYTPRAVMEIFWRTFIGATPPRRGSRRWVAPV